MKCPECGNEMERGFLEGKDTASRTQRDTMAIWYPEDEKGKFFKKGLVHLGLKAEGYYCKECMKVVAIFEER